MQIYWIQAQAPRRVLALVKHLGIEAELVEMDLMAGALRRPDYAAINPNMKAPALVDGDYRLWESSAIMAYLCVKAGSDMWPTDAREQIEVLRWLSWNDCHWAQAVSPYYFEHIVKPTFGIGPPDESQLAGKGKDFNRYAAVLDTHLQRRDHVACGRLTIADFQLASMAAYWRTSTMPMAPFPNIVQWLDGLARLPAWADPWPDGRAAPA